MSFSFDYKPYGATLEAFMASNALVRGLMGPVGGGKTRCCISEIIRRAQAQEPDEYGVRRFKCVAVRHTYRQLEDTTIPDWKAAFSDPVSGKLVLGKWRGGAGGEPATHTFNLRLPDGTFLAFEMSFRAIGDNNIESFCRGLAVTMVWLNEADTLPYELFLGLLDRVGRFPMSDKLRATWCGMICDFNAPNVKNWCYDVFVRSLPEGWAFFRQPSGLSAQAENLPVVGSDFYRTKVIGRPEWWVRRFVKNQFGFSREGKPVYPEFDETVHVYRGNLFGNRGFDSFSKIYVGLDGGRTPTAVFVQALQDGRKAVLREFCCKDMGADDFGRALRDFIAREFQDHDDFMFIGDPAMGNPSEGNDTDALTIIGGHLGVKVRAAATNKLTPRLEGVRQTLLTVVGDGRELMVHESCHTLIDGFMSDYRFRKITRAGDSDYYDEEPDKHADSSHPHDCLQYVILEVKGYRQVLGRKKRPKGSEGGKGYGRFAA